MTWLLPVFLILGGILLVFGEFKALRSVANVKRMLIISAFAECGYLLLGFGAGGFPGTSGALLHLYYQAVLRTLAYVAAWRLANACGSWRLSDLRGAHRAMPYTTLMFGFALFSFMGLSPFKGAISKFVVMFAAVDSGNHLAAAAATIGSLIAVAYLLRTIQAICFEAPEAGRRISTRDTLVNPTGLVCLALTAVAVMSTLFPEPILLLCENAAAFFMGLSGEQRLPQFKGAWPPLVLVPYLGGFAVYAVGKVAPGMRNPLAAILAIATVIAVGLLPAGDSLSSLFAMLIAMAGAAIVIYSLGYVGNGDNSNRYFFFLFLMLGSLLGVVTVEEFGTFYLFWELMTWTSYLLVIHKQTPEALRAGKKYFVMCAAGAYVMHYGILLAHAHANSFEIAAALAAAQSMPASSMLLVGAMFLIGFGVKAGLFPMHGWLPDAHPVAPSSISAPMSGLLTKAGFFGVLLFIPFFGDGVFAWGTSEPGSLAPPS